MAYLNASKTLDFIRGVVGVRGNYRRMESSLLSQGIQTDYNNDSFSLTPFINGSISTFLNWNLRFAWEKSLLKISNMPSRSSNSYVYSGNLTITPCSLVTWTTGGEYYCNQIEEGNYKRMFMLDTKVTFNISNRLELSVSGTNLFNYKEYNYTSYGTVLQHEHSSALRGREFLISVYLKK